MSATTELLEHLDAWLAQQPQWVALLAGDRRQRRVAADLIAKHIMTLPAREARDVVITREAKRKLIRTFNGQVSKTKVKLSKRAQRQANEVAKQHRRYQRLSLKRLEDLAAREAARQAAEAAADAEYAPTVPSTADFEEDTLE